MERISKEFFLYFPTGYILAAQNTFRPARRRAEPSKNQKPGRLLKPVGLSINKLLFSYFTNTILFELMKLWPLTVPSSPATGWAVIR